jgi:hypothetical protein
MHDFCRAAMTVSACCRRSMTCAISSAWARWVSRASSATTPALASQVGSSLYSVWDTSSTPLRKGELVVFPMVVGIATGQMAQRRRALGFDVFLIIIHVEAGLRGVLHPPDYNGGNLDGVDCLIAVSSLGVIGLARGIAVRAFQAVVHSLGGFFGGRPQQPQDRFQRRLFVVTVCG